MSAFDGMIKGKKPYASRGASFSRLRSGQNCKPSEQKATSGRLSSSSSSSSNPAARSDGVLEYWSTAPSPNCARVAGKGCPMGRFDSGICPRTMATNTIQLMKDALRTSTYRPYGGCPTLSRRGLPGFVPEGLNDRSQAIYCLVSMQKGDRPVGHGMIGSNRRATIGSSLTGQAFHLDLGRLLQSDAQS